VTIWSGGRGQPGSRETRLLDGTGRLNSKHPMAGEGPARSSPVLLGTSGRKLERITDDSRSLSRRGQAALSLTPGCRAPSGAVKRGEFCSPAMMREEIGRRVTSAPSATLAGETVMQDRRGRDGYSGVRTAAFDRSVESLSQLPPPDGRVREDRRGPLQAPLASGGVLLDRTAKPRADISAGPEDARTGSAAGAPRLIPDSNPQPVRRLSGGTRGPHEAFCPWRFGRGYCACKARLR